MGDSDETLWEYMGSYPPDILPQYLNQGFGLIWDGNSTESCAGVIGNYLKYNNPHKCSLYLASGIPVIVWKKAALADFINIHNAGILVESLEEIPEKIQNLSEKEYIQMKNNAEKISLKLKDGYFLKKAIRTAEKLLLNN